MQIKPKITGKNKQYLKNMVESASPMQLIVLLYDGAVQWLQMAKKEIEKNSTRKPPNWTEFSHNIDMTLKILTHLQESLNHEKSEDLSEKLFSLYEFLKNLVIKVNAYKKETDIDDAIDIIKNLKKSWQEAMVEKSKASKAPMSDQV
jgi:flagellar protein FliS